MSPEEVNTAHLEAEISDRRLGILWIRHGDRSVVMDFKVC